MIQNDHSYTYLIRIIYHTCVCCAGVRSFTLSVDSSRNVRLIVEGEEKDSLSLSNPSNSQTSAILAYKPNYQDYHSSGLAGLFVNIKQVFPCTEKIDNYEPVCKTFSREEDGFRGGKAFIEAGDIGNNMKVFSGSSVYALAVQGCGELDGSCFPNYLQVEVVCMLPRCQCP